MSILGFLGLILIVWRVYCLIETIWTREGLIGLWFLFNLLFTVVTLIVPKYDLHRLYNNELFYFASIFIFLSGLYLLCNYYKPNRKKSFHLDMIISQKLPTKSAKPSILGAIMGIIIYSIIYFIASIILAANLHARTLEQVFSVVSINMAAILIVIIPLTIMVKPFRMAMNLLANIVLLGLFTSHITSNDSAIILDNPIDVNDSYISNDSVSVDTYHPTDSTDLTDTNSTNNLVYNNIIADDNACSNSTNIKNTINVFPIPNQPNEAITIQDTNGFAVEYINPITSTHATITDNMGIMNGDITKDSITGDITLHNSAGLSIATITNEGTIQGIDGLTDGHIIHMENGSTIIQDNLGHTLGYINQQGIITSADGKMLGKIKHSN
ncbi:MAG: hypothetical protein J6H31_01720 [Butyrivibrio sp.]|nr:hypothetical protein [Butyrivibrio sp.]